MEQLYIPVKKQARVAIQGDPATCSYLWIVCHGYGQLAPFFIRKFSELPLPDHAVIAPEGLHRFYLQGYTGRVGASWMTSEERLKDIEDYIGYLDTVAGTFNRKENPPITIGLGFSQGAATISRWAAAGKNKPDHIILWSGVFPPDMNMMDVKAFEKKLWFVYGDEDEFTPAEKYRQYAESLKTLYPAGIIEFKGNHNIPVTPLLDLAQRITGM